MRCARGAALTPERVVIVAGHGADAVTRVAQDEDDSAQIVLQSRQLGTAHAVDQARAALQGFSGDVVVLYGDTPFVQPETLERMIAARADHDLVILGFQAADPARYGRLVMSGDALEQIVEFKDATPAERAISLCNSGLVACDAATLFDLIAEVGNDNAAAEYYLTDIVALARARGLSATAVTCDESETLGINSRAELATADAVFQGRARAALLASGVTLMAPETVYLAQDTVIGRDTVIEPNVVFGPGVTVESRRDHPRLQPSGRLPCQPGRNRRPLCPPAPRCRTGGTCQGRQFRRNQERPDRRRRQGQPPELYRRCDRRRSGEYRRRDHHLQLRRRDEASDHDRRQDVHRLQHDAGGAGQRG